MSYKLSASLAGHTSDVSKITTPYSDLLAQYCAVQVRSVAADRKGNLYSGSRDSTARAWSRDSGTWELKKVYTGYHEGFINAVGHLSYEGEGALLYTKLCPHHL